jgi:phosphate transport system permease protein
VTIGALTFITFLPPYPGKELITEDGATRTAGLFEWVHSAFTVLPIQMFTWVREAKAAFQVNAAATGVVLLAVTLAMNSVAIILRNRLRKRIQW